MPRVLNGKIYERRMKEINKKHLDLEVTKCDYKGANIEGKEIFRVAQREVKI